MDNCDNSTNTVELHTSLGWSVFPCYQTHENNVVVLRVFMSILLEK